MISKLHCPMFLSLMIVTRLACGLEALPSAPVTAAAPASYSPSVADLMTSAVQTRHVKLGLAVAAHNWSYGAYEVRELRNAFARIVRTIPVYEKQPTESLMNMAAAPIDALEAAIKAQDVPGSARAYEVLTATCNACHQALKRDYIVIVAPRTGMFPDQSFGYISAQ